MEYFVHVAELGSFTRASAFLKVVQPALSRRVRNLEVELRQTLFERNGRGVTLTEAGTRLLAHSRGILQQVERARQDLEDHRGAASGRLAIGLPPSVSRTLTGPLVAAFRERFPKATLTVVEGLSTYVLEWLAIGRIDCAVVYNVAPSAAIDLVPVMDEPLYLVSARAAARKPGRSKRLIGPAISLHDLATQELVMPSRPHSIRMVVETALAAQGLRARVGMEVESVPAILDLVAAKTYQAVLSLNAVKSSGLAARFSLRPIGEPGLQSTLWIATSAQRPRGPLLEQSTALVQALLLALWPKALPT